MPFQVLLESNVERGNSCSMKVPDPPLGPEPQTGVELPFRAPTGGNPQRDREQVGSDRAANGRNVAFLSLSSDNSIKNHFYSLLRRSLRKLNAVIQQEHIKDVK